MDPKSFFLLGLLTFRIGKITKNGKWVVEHEPRKFKNHHNSSIFLTLQSTGPTMTSLCLKGWCDKADDVFVVPYQYVNWQKPTEQWVIEHFEKMIYHSQRLPQQAQWYMFAFDNNYVFMDRLVKDLKKFDPHLPIYMILRDPKAKFPHKPVVIFSRFALNSFYEQASEKCDRNSGKFEEWLETCMSVPSINMSLDRKNKSRVFAISRHFQPYEYELNRNNNYHDDKEYIYSHSGSLLSFTNLDEIDAKLLPIFLEKVRTGKNR